MPARDRPFCHLQMAELCQAATQSRAEGPSRSLQEVPGVGISPAENRWKTFRGYFRLHGQHCRRGQAEKAGHRNGTELWEAIRRKHFALKLSELE